MMLLSMLTCIVLPAAAETEKVSYADTLINLYTKSADRAGVVNDDIGGNGAYSNNDKFYSTDYIAVQEGDVLTFGPCRTTQGYQLIALNADKVTQEKIASTDIASYTAFTHTDDTVGNVVFCKYTVPAGISYVRATTEVLFSNSYLLTKNQEFTLQNWQDYVAAQYPHTDLINLYNNASPIAGRWAANGLVTSNEYYAPTVQVAKNDVLYYGPADAGQGYQLVYFADSAMTSGTQVKSSSHDGYNATGGTLKIVDTFDNGQVLYAYRAQAAGYIGIAVPQKYNDFAMITKNQPLTTQNFHNFWDNKADANLYNINIDMQKSAPNADGSLSYQANHNTTHQIAVTPGDVLEFGPCMNNQTYHAIGLGIDREQVTGKIGQSAMTVLGSSASGGVYLRYTVPENVYYLQVCNRITYNTEFSVRRATPLQDSDNLYERDKYPMGLWKANASSTAFQDEYYASAQYEVKAGEVLYFGPAQYAQGYQVVFNSTDGAISATVANNTADKYTNAAGSLNVYDTFDNSDYVIYSYRATKDGTVAFPVRSELHDKFLVTRTPFSVRQFHQYWDSKEGADLYDPILDYIGQVMNPDGTYRSGWHNTSHAIAVTPGETISFGPVQVSQGYDLLTRDALGTPHNKTYKATRGEAIAKTDLTYLPSEGSGEPSDYAIYSYTVPENVYYINIVNRSWVNDYFAIKRGTMTAAEYYEIVGIQPDSPLKGKTALFVGDSISAAAHDSRYMRNKGMGAWAGRIGWYYQLTDTNKSVGGSTIAIDTGRTYIADQITGMAGNSYDYVIIQGGVNDANLGVAEGKISSSYDPADFDRTTYAGGLEYNIAKAIELYGDTAAIGYIINYQLPNRATTYNRFGEFVDTAKAICAKWGIEYIDLYNNEAITAAMDLKTKGSLYAQDDLHATERGYEVLYPVIGDWMETLTVYEDPVDWDNLAAEAIASVRALDLSTFTAASQTAFAEAMAALPTEGHAKYLAVLAATDLLEQETALPVGSYTGSNAVLDRLFGKAWSYSVSTVAELQTLATLTANGVLKSDATIKQLNDIDLAGTANLMISSSAAPFAAIYDGQGFAIKNMTLTGAKDIVAFFPYLSGTVKNVTFTGADIAVNGWSAVVVSQAMGGSVLQNVHVKNSTVTKTGDNNGLSVLVCQGNSGAFTIQDCTVSGCTVTVTTDRNTYGNVGYILSSDKGHAVTVSNCYAFGNTLTLNTNDTARNIAGLAGELFAASIVENSGAFGNTFSKELDGIAGLVGSSIAAVTIRNSYTDHAKIYNGAAAETNNYAAVPAANISSGKLAYALKTTTGAAWVQNSYPSLNAGQAVTKAEYVVQEQVIHTTYTNAEGRLIAAYPGMPEVEGYLFENWESSFAENGDTTFTAQLLLYADVNADGENTTADATLLMQYLVGKEVSLKTLAADLDQDGRISIYDAVLLLRLLSA